MSTRPRAYVEGVCADCGERLIESERSNVRRCAGCLCAMHSECGITTVRGDDSCDACFHHRGEHLGIPERTAVEDAITHLKRSVRANSKEILDFVAALERVLVDGASRRGLYDLALKMEVTAGRFAMATALVKDASQMDSSTELEDEPETEITAEA